MRQHGRDTFIKQATRVRSELGQFRGGNVTRPRAADDFATIRARMEELRRERAQALKDPRHADETIPGSRGLLKEAEGRRRSEQDRWPALPSSRRYGSGR